MKILDVEQNSEEWLEARKGMITGSRFKEVISAKVGTLEEVAEKLDSLGIEYPKTKPRKEGAKPKPKLPLGELERMLPDEVAVEMMLQGERPVGFYKLVAEKISVPRDTNIDPMERGHYYEQEALDIYSKKTGHKVERVGMFISEFSEHVGNSPDGATKNEQGIYWLEQEVKCLATYKHLQAYDTQLIPVEYTPQVIQYFVVNELLEELHFIMFDPNIPESYACRHFYIVIRREDFGKLIHKYRIYEKMLLEAVDTMIDELAGL